MSHQGKSFSGGSHPADLGASVGRVIDQTQLDFEIDFFAGVIGITPDYVDVLRVMGNLYTLKGRYADGLQVYRRLVQLKPGDTQAHYNLACSYALLKKPEQSIKTLCHAVELGYRDFRYMRE